MSDTTITPTNTAPTPQIQRLDSDTPWKLVLDKYLFHFMHLCYPDIAEHINWQKPYVPLDKELSKITKEAELGNRIADKLYRVFLNDGSETWVLIHLEIQSGYEKAFAKRMFVYYYRLMDLYDKPIISLAVLTDNNPNWRPDKYATELFGCYVHMGFRLLKVLDYQSQIPVLTNSLNPFAMVMLSHLALLERPLDAQNRLQQKIHLTRLLLQKGWEREQILDFYTFLDWLIQLPKGLDIVYNTEIHKLEEENQMAYITTAERIGREQGMKEGLLAGIQQGIKQGIERGIEQGIERGIEQGIEQGRIQGEAEILLRLLTHKFGRVPEQYRQKIEQASAEQLLQWSDKLLEATSLPDVFNGSI